MDRKEVLQIVEGLMNRDVYLRGFGSFVVKHRAEKVVRNIGKNMSIIIPAYDIPHFKPSKNFGLD